jgi:hypothetical protein
VRVKFFDDDKARLRCIDAFTDCSRRPYRQANRLPAPVEATIVRLKREYPGGFSPAIRNRMAATSACT